MNPRPQHVDSHTLSIKQLNLALPSMLPRAYPYVCFSKSMLYCFLTMCSTISFHRNPHSLRPHGGGVSTRPQADSTWLVTSSTGKTILVFISTPGKPRDVNIPTCLNSMCNTMQTPTNKVTDKHQAYAKFPTRSYPEHNSKMETLQRGKLATRGDTRMSKARPTST